MDAKILLVDDEEDFLEQLEEILSENTPFIIRTAKDGNEAIKAAQGENFDLLVTDVRMPRKSGLEVFEEIKKNNPNISAIIMTGFAEESAVVKALKLGALDYIYKPINLPNLINLIKQHLTMKQLKTQLEEHRMLLLSIVSTIDVGIIAIDQNRNINHINMAAKKLLATSDIAVENLSQLKEALSGPQNEQLRELIDEIAESDIATGQGSFEREVTVKRLDREQNFLFSVRGFTSNSGQISGLVLLINDITYIIEAQKLNAWKKMSRMIAHDIKNPLASMKIFAQHLQEIEEMTVDEIIESKEDFVKCASNIVSSIDRLNVLVSDFYKYGDLPKVSLSSCDINDCIIQSTQIFEAQMQAMGIVSDLRLSPENPKVMADRQKLINHIFSNLLSNAIDAMEGRTGKITVSTEKTSGNKVIIIVKDDGTGISEEMKKNIFKPYSTTKKQGTGLGLVMVKHIIAQHHGEISIESEEGKGTQVQIELPLYGG